MIQENKVKYVLLLLLINFGFGFSFILIKELMLVNYPIFLLLALRFLIGSGTLLVFKIIKSYKITIKDIKYGSLVGLFIFLGFILQTIGAFYTTPAKNGLYTGLYVIFVPIILMIIRKNIQLKPLIISFICFLGIAIISNIFSDITYNVGDLLTTLCALSFAIYFILLEKYSSSLNQISFTLVQLITVALISLAISLRMEVDNYYIIKMDKYMSMIIFLGFAETGVSFLIQTHVQSKISANTVAVISCMEAVFAIFFSVILGYDTLTIIMVIGSMIVIFSMILAAKSSVDIDNKISK
jgi:drug/metabolite transporter (DMT)-like permease